MKLTRNHQDILGALRGFGLGDGWSRQLPGNFRSVRLLARYGFIESRVVVGPRGGRHVERRLTGNGIELARVIGALVEGYAPLGTDAQGNQLRTVSFGTVTFTIEG